jgi:hypothetical protein
MSGSNQSNSSSVAWTDGCWYPPSFKAQQLPAREGQLYSDLDANVWFHNGTETGLPAVNSRWMSAKLLKPPANTISAQGAAILQGSNVTYQRNIALLLAGSARTLTVPSVHYSIKRYVVDSLTKVIGSCGRIDVVAHISLEDRRFNVTATHKEVAFAVRSLGATHTRVVTEWATDSSPIVHALREACPWVAASGRCESAAAMRTSFNQLWKNQLAFAVLNDLAREQGRAEGAGGHIRPTEYDWVLCIRADMMWVAPMQWAELMRTRAVYMWSTPSLFDQHWTGMEGVQFIPGEFATRVVTALQRQVDACTSGAEERWRTSCSPEYFLWAHTLRDHRIPFAMTPFTAVIRRPGGRAEDQGPKWGIWFCADIERLGRKNRTLPVRLSVARCMQRLASHEIWPDDDGQ